MFTVLFLDAITFFANLELTPSACVPGVKQTLYGITKVSE